MKCQSCKKNRAVWRVGRDGFAAKAGAYVCDTYGCRSWADGGYPVTLIPVTYKKITPEEAEAFRARAKAQRERMANMVVIDVDEFLGVVERCASGSQAWKEVGYGLSASGEAVED